ncbi:MAG: FtsX-like permease family protein [Terriglobia bacterium]
MIRLSLFRRLFLRPLRREPLRTALTLLAVSLGVAVVLAIDLASTAATGSFLSSLQTLAGKQSFEVRAAGGVPGRVVGKLATLPYPLHVEPEITGYATVVKTGELVPLLGIDMVARAAEGASVSAPLQWVKEHDCVWTSSGLGRRPGEKLRLQLNDHVSGFKVCGILPAGFSRRAREPVIVMDIALAAQELDRGDRVDRILISVPPHGRKSMAQWAHILQAALPAGVTLERHGAEAQANRRMLAAFRWNLVVLSYIALIVGAFLIYSSLSISVVRRRREIGVLRAMGATRAFIRAGFLGEAFIYGIAGSILGIVFGRLMAQGAVGLIASTVQSLYLTSRPAAIVETPQKIALGFIVGVGVSLLSAWMPAREASHVPPVAAMARARREYEVRIAKRKTLAIAALCAVAAAIVSQLPAVEGKPLFGYVASLLLVAATAAALPALVSGAAWAISGLLRRLAWTEPYLALRRLAASLRRTSVLLASLSTAIAMLVSIAIMVGSFRKTVAIWLGNELRADFYVQPAQQPSVDRYPTLDPDVARRIRALPEVEAVDELRSFSIVYHGLPTKLAAGNPRVEAQHGELEFLPGENTKAIFREMQDGHSVVISQPFALNHGIRPGDKVTLPLAAHRVTFRVAGVYYDYSDPRGTVLMDRQTLLKYVPGTAPDGLAVYLKPGTSANEARKAIERASSGHAVVVLANGSLRRQALAVFDRTFRITYALEAVALCVAVIGMAGALLALVVDHRREIALLRFLGASTRQVRRLILSEAAVLGALGIIAGFILGLFLSLILIFVINKQSFGWTIQFHWPIAFLVAALAVVVAFTMLSALYPARVGMKLNPIEVIHEE